MNITETQLRTIIDRTVAEVLEASSVTTAGRSSREIDLRASRSGPVVTDEELVQGYVGLFGLSEAGARAAVGVPGKSANDVGFTATVVSDHGRQ